ncbi:MAG: DUF998 domain-containing protein [Candidatus Promineifilaceae bacterium]|nr:DUF998 domain-containing protein [Candidatus Promineifilaceae bacterium]
MLLYPGGTIADASTEGYRFFDNFLSDLGLTVARNGVDNLPSLLIFASSLALAGLGLVVYFAAMPGLFRGRTLSWALSLLGAGSGIISGVSFVGVAFTPANLYGQPHISFVLWAFEAFLGAALFMTLAMWLAVGRWRREAVLFTAFTILLAGYVWLLFNGPTLDEAGGLTFQATAQKIIAYTAVGATTVQAYWARQRAERR